MEEIVVTTIKCYLRPTQQKKERTGTIRTADMRMHMKFNTPALIPKSSGGAVSSCHLLNKKLQNVSKYICIFDFRSSQKSSWRVITSGIESICLPSPCDWFLAWLILRPWTWRQYVSPKRRWPSIYMTIHHRIKYYLCYRISVIMWHVSETQLCSEIHISIKEFFDITFKKRWLPQ
jgi:hypothetical protein